MLLFFLNHILVSEFGSNVTDDGASLIHPFSGPFKIFSRVRNSERRVRRLLGSKILITEFNPNIDIQNNNNFEFVNNDRSSNKSNKSGNSEINNQNNQNNKSEKDDQNDINERKNNNNNCQVVQIHKREAITEILIIKPINEEENYNMNTSYEFSEKEEEEEILHYEKEEIKIIDNFQRNNDICSYLKKSVEYDIRNTENLIYDLRMRNSLLNDVINNHLLEINRLNIIISTEPEINKKGRNLLLETIKSLKCEIFSKDMIIKKIEEEYKLVFISEKTKFEKILSLDIEINLLKSQFEVLTTKNFDLQNEINQLIGDEKNKLLEKSYIDQQNMEIKLDILKLTRSDIIKKLDFFVEESNKFKIENFNLLQNNKELHKINEELIRKNDLLKDAIMDSYHILKLDKEEKDYLKLLQLQSIEYDKIKNKNKNKNNDESILLRINNKEVFIRNDNNNEVLNTNNNNQNVIIKQSDHNMNNDIKNNIDDNIIKIINKNSEFHSFLKGKSENYSKRENAERNYVLSPRNSGQMNYNAEQFKNINLNGNEIHKNNNNNDDDDNNNNDNNNNNYNNNNNNNNDNNSNKSTFPNQVNSSRLGKSSGNSYKNRPHTALPLSTVSPNSMNVIKKRINNTSDYDNYYTNNDYNSYYDNYDDNYYNNNNGNYINKNERVNNFHNRKPYSADSIIKNKIHNYNSNFINEIDFPTFETIFVESA